jgi:VanZ family protein
MILFPWVLGSKGILEKILIITVVFVIMVGTLIPHNIAERMKTNSPVDLFGDSFTDSFEKSAGNPCTSISFDGVTEKSIENTTQSNLKWKMINNTGHFILFLILAMVLLFSFPNKNFPIFLTILMLGCATELMQFFIEGRGPGFGDLMLDIGGAFFGGLTARAIIGAKKGKFL